MSAMRMVFLTVALILMLGIWLSGFDKVHWVLYIPTVFFMFAGLTGICPGAIFWKRIGFKNRPLAFMGVDTKE